MPIGTSIYTRSYRCSDKQLNRVRIHIEYFAQLSTCNCAPWYCLHSRTKLFIEIQIVVDILFFFILRTRFFGISKRLNIIVYLNGIYSCFHANQNDHHTCKCSALIRYQMLSSLFQMNIYYVSSLQTKWIINWPSWRNSCTGNVNAFKWHRCTGRSATRTIYAQRRATWAREGISNDWVQLKCSIYRQSPFRVVMRSQQMNDFQIDYAEFRFINYANCLFRTQEYFRRFVKNSSKFQATYRRSVVSLLFPGDSTKSGAQTECTNQYDFFFLVF